MIDPREGDVGRRVIYHASGCVPEEGQISSWNDSYVHVRFGSVGSSQACRRHDLEWAFPDPKEIEAAQAEKAEALTSRRLYRAPYLVIPRLALEAMPLDWQARMEQLLEEADKTGLDCPDYYVFRNDPAYTHVVHVDIEDRYSAIAEVHVITEDPWANYRRGRIDDLCPNFRAPEPAPCADSNPEG